MKTTIIILLLTLQVSAQSWQWGKRGGSTDNLNTSGGTIEEVTDIVTDSQNNIYMISAVGKNGLDVDGVTKNYYGDPGTFIQDDFVLASFACDGTYRWSKIVGGIGFDRINNIVIDSQDNLYISGKFGGANATYPPRIDNDVIILQTPSDYSITFLAKYNSNGDLQWFKRPQLSTVSQTQGVSQTGSYSLVIDSSGLLYWLVLLPQGVYANGSYINSLSGSTIHLLKYNSNGDFISGFPIDMQLVTGWGNLKMYLNPFNSNFYFTNYDSSTSSLTPTVGGQNITNSIYLSCFNNLGQFQWVRESSSPNLNRFKIYNVTFDNENNIYMGGGILGSNTVSFLGFSVPDANQPNYVLKLNSDATAILWSTYHNNFTTAYQNGTLTLKNNEVSLTSFCFGTFTWGSQSIFVFSGGNQGQQPLLARFNKDTGACIGLHNIVNDLLTEDRGRALTVDSNGDYIMGGSFGSQLNFTTNTINATGAQSDFFIAKFSTSVCSLGVDDFKEEGLELAPNPVEKSVVVRTKENLKYELFNAIGSKVKEGTLTELVNSIDVSDLQSGSYILKTISSSGAVKSVKLLKK